MKKLFNVFSLLLLVLFLAACGKTYKVRLLWNGFDGQIEEVVFVKKNARFSLPTPKKPGYDYFGWVINGGLKKGEIIVNQDLEASFQFRLKEFVVTFKGGNVFSRPYKYGEVLGEVLLEDDEKFFVDWYKAESLEEKMRFSYHEPVTENLTLYPKFIPFSSIFTFEDALDGVMITGFNEEIKSLTNNKLEELNLTRLVIPEMLNHKKVVSLKEKAFEKITELKSVKINAKLTKISDGAFQGCLDITKLTMPDSVTEIGKHAFSGLVNVRNYKLSKNLKAIGEFSFYANRRILTMTLPESLEMIGEKAFYDCAFLETHLTLIFLGKASYSKSNLPSGFHPNFFDEGVNLIFKGS